MRNGRRLGLGLLAAVMILGWGGFAQGAIKYVTPTGGGLVDGSDWANAFSNLQAAVNACTGGGTIRMRYGTYVVKGQVVISGVTGLIVKGGYAGVGETLSGSETVIARDASVFTRLFNIANSTVTFDALAITGGSLDASVNYGMGLYASSSGLTLTNCVVANNNRDRLSTTFYGAGLYVTGGSLTVADSRFTNNFARAWNDGSYVYGGAIYAVGTAVNISGTTFDRNRCNARYLNNQGGAIYMSGGSAAISDCLFTTNSTLKNENYSRDNGRGGAIYAKTLSSLDISDSVFIGNLNNELDGRGGLIYLEGASQKTRISRCAMYGNGTRAGGAVTDSGSIYLLSGNLYMTNVLHAANRYGNSLDIGGGTAEAVNCTFAGNVNGYGIYQTGGSFALRNCIVWGNASGAFNFVGGTRGSFNYCFVQDAQAGIANSTADPRFADGVYYHVKSQAGAYSGGWFSGGAWLVSDATSPAIDAGDPNAKWANEPQPNFHRINVGYDANTPVASKSVLGEPAVFDSLMVYSYPETNRTANSAWVRGVVAHTGGAEDPTVYLAWGTNDLGTADLADWNPNVRSLGPQTLWNVFSSQLTDLPQVGSIYYRFYATNSTGSVWSRPVAAFLLPTVPVVSTVGASHVTRHAARVHGTLISNGDANTVITLHCWPEGDEENVLSFVYNLGQAVAEGTVFTILASGLSAGTDYDYSLDAVNVAGTNSATGTFTTLTTAPIVRYVTPAGAGIADGSSWENAYSNLQVSVEVCLYAGDLICLKSGTYIRLGLDDPNDNSQCFISGTAGLTIRGGYVGSGAPGARSDAPTVLARNVAALPNPNRRILRAANATLTFDSLVFSNGLLNVTGQHGHGVNLVSCHTVVTNCVFIGNGNEISGNGARTFYGGAVYAQNGTFKAVDTQFTGNRLNHPGDNATACGGAIYATDVDATLERCDFNRNFVCSWYKTHNGGALAFNNGSAVVSHCTFATNRTTRHPTDGTVRNVGWGGAIHVNATRLDLSDSVFIGNYGFTLGGAGGVLYLGHASQKTTLTRCAFSGSGLPGNTNVRNHGEITLAAGSLAMTNVLVGATANTNTMEILSGTLAACNVTIAGAVNGYGIWKAGGTATLKNSIIWGNSAGGVGGASGSLSATYTASQQTLPGTGNFVGDPLFADGTYYHLKSRGGCYAGGYFTGGAWQRSPVSSPCIDAGDGSPFGAEPKYNGKRINLGAYGNTPVASITYRPEGAVMILR